MKRSPGNVVAAMIVAVLLAGCTEGDLDAPPAAEPNPVLDLPLDATIALPNLPATTDVAIDSLGMLHVYAPDTRSALFVQGYETAKARFWQLDAFRRVAEGRLSRLFGGITIGMDVEMRTAFTTRDGRRLQDVLWEDLQASDPSAAAQAESYAAGINAWIADARAGRNGATLPPEYSATGLDLSALEDWDPRDTLAIGRLQAFFLSASLDEEIGFAEIYSALPEALRRDVYRSAPGAPATVLPANGTARAQRASARPSAQLPPLEILRAVRVMLDELHAASPLGHGAGVGSNNWIVSKEASATGFPMLANDPHLQLFNPPIWHMVQLDAADDPTDPTRVTGVQFPGLPGIILGHNDYGAWGGTVAVFDVTDVYVEQITTPPDYPNSPRTVLFKGQQVPLLRLEEQFDMGDGTFRTEIIEVVPHHGPMVPDPNLEDDVVGIAATGMSFRWTGHEITQDSRFLTGINRARNVEEFKDAIRFFGVGAQNWVWADIHGDTTYFPYVLVPQRPAGAVPWLPLRGTGEDEWLQDANGNTLWLPEDKFPQADELPQGYLATSNNDQFGNTLDNDPLNDESYFTFTADIGFRQQRILDLLSNRANVRPQGAKLTVEDLIAYQNDTVSLEAARLVPFLFAAAENRADLVTAKMSDAITRLRAWSESKEGSPAWIMASGVDAADVRDDLTPRAVPVSDEERADAVGAAIFAGWSTRLSRKVFADDFIGTGIGAPGGDDATKALLHILEDIDATDPNFVVHTKGTNGESTLWDDTLTPAVETRDEIILGALADGIVFLEQALSSTNPADWLWGNIHQARFQHFFGQAGIPIYDLGNFPAPGGRFTVNPAHYSLNSDAFVFSDGPSKRFVALLDPSGIRSVSALPGGNNGNPGTASPEIYNTINPAIHYGDHTAGWINGDRFEYRVTRAAVAADTELHIRYVPAP